MYVACRGLLKRKVPTVIVPNCVKEKVENLFAVQRELDASPLPVNLVGMDVSPPPLEPHSLFYKQVLSCVIALQYYWLILWCSGS